jgi:hypothetical protein
MMLVVLVLGLSFVATTLATAFALENEKYFNIGVMFPMQKDNLPLKSNLNFAAMYRISHSALFLFPSSISLVSFSLYSQYAGLRRLEQQN